MTVAIGAAVYMALTLVAEAGIVQRLFHSAQRHVVRHWHRQRRRPASRGLSGRLGSSGRDVEAVVAVTEDEDVRAEREMIQSGGKHCETRWCFLNASYLTCYSCVLLLGSDVVTAGRC